MSEKPSPDFPLFPHRNGQWAKKIGGRLKYFGPWSDPEAALARFLEQTQAPTVFTVTAACELFLDAKSQAVALGEISERTFKEYVASCKRFVGVIGRNTPVSDLGPRTFETFQIERSQVLGVVAIGNEITRIRSVFRWLHQAQHVREPINFGPDFKKPGARVLRRHRRQQGKKLFDQDQIHRLLGEAGLQMRAMILLGINCGFGNTDCATLPLDALDLDGGWIDFPRPKTEVDRLCPLWPETADALRTWVARRPKPRPEAEGRVFVTGAGRPWDHSSNPVAKRFRFLLIWAEIPKGGFYWLRHTFETVGGGSKDQVAVNAIMGHVDSSMAAVYREEIEQDRLRAVTDHVRAWLFREAAETVE